MEHDSFNFLLEMLDAQSVTSASRVQSLWSGYGQIVRVGLSSGAQQSVIVKHIDVPQSSVEHPRGWNTNVSHQRKLRSYEVEFAWYRSADWNGRCESDCRTAKFLGDHHVNGQWLVLEDLDSSGFDGRHHSLSDNGLHACLRWLASFHACFLIDRSIAANQNWPAGLWPVGTYWHLATRPDELDAMADGPLKSHAAKIDQTLNETRFQTIVHGDAKVANFCFSDDQQTVAAVDFQYVGGGCGMKDVAYFMGSCLTEIECEDRLDDILAIYFAELRRRIRDSEIDVDEVEAEWRALFPIAWSDFHRFLLGWCPTHHKITSFSNKMVAEALESL